MREKRRGYWEVRVFVGYDDNGKPIQMSKTLRGTKKDANRVAAQLTLKPTPAAGRRTVAELIDAYVMHKTPTWAIQTQHGNEGRAKSIKRDAIAAMSVARVGVSEVDAWHLRLRRRALGEGAVRNQHSFLRAVFQQAVRWEWITHNPVASATLRRQRVQPRDAMTPDEVNRVMAALRWEKVRDDKVIVDQQVIVDRRNTPRYVVATTKTANRRVISLDDRTLQMIRELRLRRRALTPWMFGEDPGTPAPDRIGWWWRRARALAGIDPKWRLHDLRHFSATQAATT